MIETQLKIDDLNYALNKWKEKSFLSKFGILLFLLIPLLLFLLQFLIVKKIIPLEITFQYLRLEFTEPNILSMFFSNYIHNIYSYNHLLQNYLGYVIISFAIVILYFIIIPVVSKQKTLNLDYPDLSFWLTLAIIFFAFPFAESGISIYFGRMIIQTGKWGISGILWALTAYLVFIFVKFFYDCIISKIQLNIKNVQELILVLIFLLSFIIIAPIYFIFLDFGNLQVGVFGHFAGYTLGILISIFVAIIVETKKEKLRLLFLIFLVLVIIIPSIFWIFFNPPSPFITSLT